MVDLSALAFLGTILINPSELFCFFLIVSLSVNLEFGYAGIPNFGKVLFVASGGFVSGALAYRLMVYVLNLKGDIFTYEAINQAKIDGYLTASPEVAIGLLLAMIVIAAVVGMLFGYLASYPAIRLREDYLGMLLLAAGEFFNIFSVAYTPFLGGSLGSFAPDPAADLGASIGFPNEVVLGVLAVFAIFTYVYAERVGRSPLGRTLRAQRDNEIASEAVGKDNVALRRNTLLIGSALAGVAGVLYLFVFPLMTPGTTAEATFNRVADTFVPFVIVILGGAANNRGVLAGTFVYLLIYNAFSQASTYYAPSLSGTLGLVGLDNIKFMLIGTLVIVILLRRPQGLIPEKPSLTMAKSKLLAIADSVKGKAPEEKTKST
ncbi:MAG TPA: branched-chain amino acid ABC transporter permease [Nitrososphaerales archaeon]|nr:branched-chain amino acid ABC transporter permease [Nitrososphaerales archaeon]